MKDKKKENLQINHVPAGTTLKGVVHTSRDMRIDGHFEGLIYSEGRLVIGKKGFVIGELNCHDLTIYGKMEGKIESKGKLELSNSASLVGDITVQSLEVQHNAFFNGRCLMLPNEKESAQTEQLSPDEKLKGLRVTVGDTTNSMTTTQKVNHIQSTPRENRKSHDDNDSKPPAFKNFFNKN